MVRTAAQLHQAHLSSTNFLRQETNFRALSGGDDRITLEDLNRAADDRSLTEAQREQAAKLLGSPAFRHALDVGAGRGEIDGKISVEDVEGLAQLLEEQGWSGPTIGVEGRVDSEAEARAVLERYQLLADTAAGKGGRNGHVSQDDARALVNDEGVPPELRAAARFILDEEVDLPGRGGGLFGSITGPLRSVGGWTLDRLDDGADEVQDAARDRLFSPDRLDDEERADLMEAAREAAERPGTSRPLNEQRNAHLTNTAEEMRAALASDADWLEGDVRRDPPVMGHDWHQAGLTLEDWLAIGKESGRGLKIDIKEGGSVDAVIEAVEAADIPSDRLMLNVDALAGPGGSGHNVAPADVEKLRAAFPDARISIGAKVGDTADGTRYAETHVSQMIALAERIGGPVLFPLRADLVSPQIVERLSQHGDVSIWNSPRTTDLQNQTQVAAEAERFRGMGVTGVIDLRDRSGH